MIIYKQFKFKIKNGITLQNYDWFNYEYSNFIIGVCHLNFKNDIYNLF